MDNPIIQPERLLSASQFVKSEIDFKNPNIMKTSSVECSSRANHVLACRLNRSQLRRRRRQKRDRDRIEFQNSVEPGRNTPVITKNKKIEREEAKRSSVSQENKYAINNTNHKLLINQSFDHNYPRQIIGCEHKADNYKPTGMTEKSTHQRQPASLPPPPPPLPLLQQQSPPLPRLIEIRKPNSPKQRQLIKALILLQLFYQTAGTFYSNGCSHSNLLTHPVLFATAHHPRNEPNLKALHEQEARKKTLNNRGRIDELLSEQILVDNMQTRPIDFIKRNHPSIGSNLINNGDSVKQIHKSHNHKRRHHNNNANDDIAHSQYYHHHRAANKNGRTKRHDEQGSNYFTAAADRPVVSTKKGLIRGITQKIVNGKFVDAFLGIPFGQAPTGRYRFRHPQPVNPWQGELDASKLSKSCYQVNDTFFGANFMGTLVWNANTPLDEDCLHLNIWTPFGVANTIMLPSGSQNNLTTTDHKQQQPSSTSSKSSKRAVLVWIFGGGFYSGTSSLALYEGGALASEEDIIVVSINYRVSALGFLYFGRPDAPGNAGLFDQLLALQWINDNIDQFGGDSERITIFGESAGAVSVAFHLLSPLSRNLFSQAILQSGAATCPWGSMDASEIIANGLQLAASLNCPSNQNDLDSVINCLLKADPMALVSQEIGQTRSVLNFPFVPVVDGSFLLESPAESLAKANFKQARILLGSNNDEGNAWLIYLPEFSHCPTSSAAGNAADQQIAPLDSQRTTLPPTSTDSEPIKYPSSETSDIQQANTNTMNNLRPEDDTLVGEWSSAEQIDLSKRNGDVYNRLQVNNQLDNPQSSSMIHRTPASMTTMSNKQEQHQNQLGHQQFQDQNDSKPCKPIEYLSLSREDFFHVLREELNPYAEHPIGKEAIVFEYSNWNNPQDPMSIYDSIDKIVGDYYFTCHVNEFAQQYALAGNAVYMYYFKHRSTRSPWPKWMGVLHGDEISFVFGEPLNRALNYTTKEIELSRRMMRYWGNFAKFGDPTKTSENTTMSEKWPQYSDRRQYFELHSEYIRIGRGPRAKQCAFWANYLPRLIQSFDRGQCQALNLTAQLSPATTIHLFPSSSHQIGLPDLRNLFQQQLQQKLLSTSSANSFINSIPSALLFGLILIPILALLFGIYFVVSKKSSSNWKLSLWPLGGASSTNGGTSSGASGAQASNRGGPSESSG